MDTLKVSSDLCEPLSYHSLKSRNLSLSWILPLYLSLGLSEIPDHFACDDFDIIVLTYANFLDYDSDCVVLPQLCSWSLDLLFDYLPVLVAFYDNE